MSSRTEMERAARSAEATPESEANRTAREARYQEFKMFMRRYEREMEYLHRGD